MVPCHGGDAACPVGPLASGGDPECIGGSVQRGIGAVQRAHDAAVEGLQRSLDVRASAERYRTAVGADRAGIGNRVGDYQPGAVGGFQQSLVNYGPAGVQKQRLTRSVRIHNAARGVGEAQSGIDDIAPALNRVVGVGETVGAAVLRDLRQTAGAVERYGAAAHCRSGVADKVQDGERHRRCSAVCCPGC